MRRPGVLRDVRPRHRPQRSVAVKSRGHFRAGFDEFFKHEQIVEVDLPGLTSPMLERFDWTRLPRPVIPLDRDVTGTMPEL
jgi:microcystin degradation protein MlrC